jgi:hypothetical protein
MVLVKFARSIFLESSCFLKFDTLVRSSCRHLIAPTTQAES